MNDEQDPRNILRKQRQKVGEFLKVDIQVHAGRQRFTIFILVIALKPVIHVSEIDECQNARERVL
jgi:hypothetical protein